MNSSAVSCPAHVEVLEHRTHFSSTVLAHAHPAAAPLLNATTHVTDVDAEDLAKNVAYEDWNAGDTVNVDHGYVVRKVFDNPIDGFYGIMLAAGNQSPVLVLRGTENQPQDVAADADPRGVGYRQFKDNYGGADGVKVWLDEMARFDAADGGGVADIVGHSLGGALAQWIAAEYTRTGHSIGRVVTFNSPGISAKSARQFKPGLAVDVTHFVTSGDVVSMAGQAFIAGQYALAHFSSHAILGDSPGLQDIVTWESAKHSTHILTSDGGAPPADLVIDAPAPTATLNVRKFTYTDPEYATMRQDLSNAIDAIPFANFLYGKIPAALKARWSTEANRSRIFNTIFGLVSV